MTQRCQVQVMLSFCLIRVIAARNKTRSEAFATSSSIECCNECIGKTSHADYDYDPVIFSQCTKVTGGICCFECGNVRDPMYGDTVSYADDGVTAVAQAGTYISFTWSDVENVTYVSLKTGQKKTVTPTVSDTAATKTSDTFLICARSAGTIYFRGWGSDTCREASPEHSITIEAIGSSSTTCDGSDVQITTLSEGYSGLSLMAADEVLASCNKERASVEEVDGISTCVCASDWANPPKCDRWPLWKWFVTIGGGLSACLAILISVRAIVQRLKKMKQEEENKYRIHLALERHEDEFRENLAPLGTKSDLELIDYIPENGYHDDATLTPFKEAECTPGGTRRTDERIFSL